MRHTLSASKTPNNGWQIGLSRWGWPVLRGQHSMQSSSVAGIEVLAIAFGPWETRGRGRQAAVVVLPQEAQTQILGLEERGAMLQSQIATLCKTYSLAPPEGPEVCRALPDMGVGMA